MINQCAQVNGLETTRDAAPLALRRHTAVLQTCQHFFAVLLLVPGCGILWYKAFIYTHTAQHSLATQAMPAASLFI